MDRLQCKATKKRNGERCKNSAIPGGTVCRFHGGAAPQVQRKAAERLAELRDDAMGLLALQIRKTVECIEATMTAAAKTADSTEHNHPQLVGYVEPAVAARAVKDLSELVETLEGRVARREGVAVDAAAGARDILASHLDRLAERSREVCAPQPDGSSTGDSAADG